ncbi:MAG: VCBS repeat-containing protein [Pirellulales bacterium]
MGRMRFVGAVLALACGLEYGVAAEPTISFKKTRLDDKFRSEGVAVADFDLDGKADVAAGSVWYSAPDWKMHVVREKAEEFKPEGYSDSFVNYADDLNGDGRPDLLVVDFPGKPTWWFENPKDQTKAWTKHKLTPVTNNESPQYLDLDGDGKREWIMGTSDDEKNSDGPQRYQAIVRRTATPNELWTTKRISAFAAPMTTKYSHGIGAGDVNKDGRADFLIKDGWWEAPATESDAEWTFHPVKFGAESSQIYVYDVDGDGDNDVINASAHKVGLWWHEQTPEGWKSHVIDESISQTHAVELVDIDGDGLKDIVTGKRYWAHGPKGDVDPGAPAMLVWYKLTRDGGKAIWTQREIDRDSGVGTQFQVADINGDGLPDVAIANKKGVFIFEQQRTTPAR